MTTESSTDDPPSPHPPPPQFASFPESAFAFGGYATATLRRVKPLPRSKRRRMSEEGVAAAPAGSAAAAGVTSAVVAGLPYGAWTTAAAAAAMASMPGGYPPPVGFTFDLSGQGAAGGVYHHLSSQGEEYQTRDDDGTDGDGRDRGDQQGNTKKRKVPAAGHHRHNGRFGGGSSSDEGEGEGGGGGDDDLPWTGESVDASGTPSGKAGGAPSDSKDTSAGTGSGVKARRAKQKLSLSTSTGLKLKEIAKGRKKLLSTVLPSIAATTGGESGDLALNLALLAPLKWPPLALLPKSTEPLASKSRRQRKRTLERRKIQHRRALSTRFAMPNGEFTLDLSSSSSERMSTTMAEVMSLRAKFSQELARIAARQVETAKKSAAAAAKSGSVLMAKKRSEGSKAGSSPGGGAAGAKLTGEGGSTTSKKKKKKGNKANDPHQIRNYIPSRLPSGAGSLQPPTPAQAAQNLKSLVSPHPVLFLSAEPKSRPSKKSGGGKENARTSSLTGSAGVTSSLPPVQPMDEWICGFCEFNLFYGDESALRRAVRARKSLLSRRRRARERAAAAASGQGKLLASGAKKDEDESEEDEDESEDLPEEEQEAKFVDPAEVDARVAASMGEASRKPVLRDKA